MRFTRTHTILAGLSAALALTIATNTHAQGLSGVAAEIGITPEALVVADFSTSEAQVMLTHLGAADSARQALAAAHQSLNQVLDQMSALRARFKANPGDEQIRTQLRLARAQLQTARERLEQAQELLFRIAVDGFAANDVQRIRDCRSGERYRVPPSFRAVVRTDGMWSGAERALRAERRCARMGEELDDAYAGLLSDIRGDPQVAYAQVRLETRLEAMRRIFEGV